MGIFGKPKIPIKRLMEGVNTAEIDKIMREKAAEQGQTWPKQPNRQSNPQPLRTQRFSAPEPQKNHPRIETCFHCGEPLDIANDFHYTINKQPGLGQTLYFHEDCFIEIAGEDYKL